MPGFSLVPRFRPPATMFALISRWLLQFSRSTGLQATQARVIGPGLSRISRRTYTAEALEDDLCTTVRWLVTTKPESVGWLATPRSDACIANTNTEYRETDIYFGTADMSCA